jgi:hypothetical protein
MKLQSTRYAAKRLGISLMTLQRYIADGNWIKAPALQKIGGVRVRLWSDRDIARAKKLMKAR